MKDYVKIQVKQILFHMIESVLDGEMSMDSDNISFATLLYPDSDTSICADDVSQISKAFNQVIRFLLSRDIQIVGSRYTDNLVSPTDAYYLPVNIHIRYAVGSEHPDRLKELNFAHTYFRVNDGIADSKVFDYFCGGNKDE